MATANKTMSATKVVIPCRISFAAIFEPKSINGSEAKYAMKNEIRETAPGRTFRVVITETLKRVVEVNESEIKEPTMDEAVQAVSDWWHNGQIVLEAEDFDGVDFSAAEGGEVGD